MLKPLEDAFLSLLQFFYNLSGSYGWAIVFLTILVRIVLLPLTIQQTKAQIDLQRIQPKVKELQKKYKDDKEKLNQELLKLYSEHKVNPFGGCLPLLIQLPVFFALFKTLNTFKPMQKEAFLFIPSLGGIASKIGFAIEAWPYWVLIALLGLTTYFSAKMLSSEKTQEMTNITMTIFLMFIAYNIPAGVLVYWLLTNILTMIQQYVQLRILEVSKV
ncbi:MAG: YidC/Oxa1 family membrane protein insertase [Actinobacteria bacterium]|nr:YidC/Oxa1 family membrane protein insertase [Actinomycetota bacterium]